MSHSVQTMSAPFKYEELIKMMLPSKGFAYLVPSNTYPMKASQTTPVLTCHPPREITNWWTAVRVQTQIPSYLNPDL